MKDREPILLEAFSMIFFAFVLGVLAIYIADGMGWVDWEEILRRT